MTKFKLILIILLGMWLMGARGVRAMGKIKVRVGADGKKEFFDTVSLASFVPRGSNYIRLANQPVDPYKGDIGGTIQQHSNFDGGLYDHVRTDQAFGQMEDDGYNLVRVFINELRVGDTTKSDPTKPGLDSTYLDNVVDFLRLAKNHSIYVDLNVGGIPYGHTYWNQWGAVDTSIFEWGPNLNVLHSGFMGVKKRYLRDFVEGLKARGAPIEAIFSYQIENEINLDGSQKPFTVMDKLVTMANGKSYSMSVPADKDRLVDEGMAYFVDEMATTLREVDPETMVTVGFFSPVAGVEQANRLVRTSWVFKEAKDGGSTIDFVDLHMYTGFRTTESEIASFGYIQDSVKPVLLGEFGSYKFKSTSVLEAAAAVKELQIATCRIGFKGWLFWTWDTEEQPEIYSMAESGGAVNGILAPTVRPDPCSPTILKNFPHFGLWFKNFVENKASMFDYTYLWRKW